MSGHESIRAAGLLLQQQARPGDSPLEMQGVNEEMRIEDLDRDAEIQAVGLRLTPSEASELRDGLNQLLQDPAAIEHIHVSSEDFTVDLTISLERNRHPKFLDSMAGA